MESSPVPKEIIVRGKKVFLLLWEYLAGNAPLESVSRYIDTDADRLKTPNPVLCSHRLEV